MIVRTSRRLSSLIDQSRGRRSAVLYSLGPEVQLFADGDADQSIDICSSARID